MTNAAPAPEDKGKLLNSKRWGHLSSPRGGTHWDALITTTITRRTKTKQEENIYKESIVLQILFQWFLDPLLAAWSFFLDGREPANKNFQGEKLMKPFETC